MEHNERYIEQIAIERAKTLDRAIVGEIQAIALEHGIEKKIVLNEDFIIAALSKQSPQKPVKAYGIIRNSLGEYCRNNDDEYWKCPMCVRYNVPLEEKQEYCHWCGQKIDWS